MKEYMKILDEDKYKQAPYIYSLVTPLRISHFYAGNFYVYKYSIGQIVGCIVAKRIISNDKEFLNKYINFLQLGTSLSPIDAIKTLGIDLYSSQPWQEASEIIQEFINEYKKQ